MPQADVGLRLPGGWALWLSIALVVAVVIAQALVARKIARLHGPKPKLRAQLGSTAVVLPHDGSELVTWVGLSVSAGFCEELLFRGFLIWILQPWVGWWLAAVLSLAVFAAAHAYQGRAGMIRSATMAAVFTVLVALTRSLWPAIVLHAALDWMGGFTGWLLLRDAGNPSPQPSASNPG